MALKTKVKISEVTNLTDARYCAGMGVDMIGFALDENHPRFIELATARDIANWISGVEVVGEFSGSNIPNADYLAKELNLDYIQVSHPFDLSESVHLHKPVILKLNYEQGEKELEHLFELYAEKVKYFQLESEHNVALASIQETLEKWCSKYPIILGIGIEVENLDTILSVIKPWGVAMKGGDEIKPGLKHFDELAEILETLEVD